MRACYSLSIILLALLSRVRAESVRVVATIPNEAELKSGASDSRPMKDVEVTGFISKNGDIFELADSESMGSIVPRKELQAEAEMARSMDSVEARQEPEFGPGMTMCRYGTIVVYSDEECDTFLKPSANLGRPIKTKYEGDKTEVQQEEEVQKPVKKPVQKPVRKPQKRLKKPQRRNQRKPIRKKAQKKRKNQKRKNQVRRKPQKQQVKKKRRRNPITQQQKQKRRRNQKRKNQQKRGGNGNKKRKRINRDDETRAYPESEAEPLQFAVIYERL